MKILLFRKGGQVGFKVQAENIQPVKTNDYPQTARRPRNSRLNTRKIEHTFDLTLPLWQTGVTRMLTEIFEKNYDPT